jgi:hypothetical protein
MNEVEKRLAEHKSEFEKVELKFKNFDFVKEMYELLLSNEDKSKNISPFSSLFNKQVGNVHDRFKLTETICAKLMHKLKGLAGLFEKFSQMSEHKCECSKVFFCKIYLTCLAKFKFFSVNFKKKLTTTSSN